MARDRSITTDDIKQYYFKMPRSHRSIRRLHSELIEKFPKKKYHHSQQYSDIVNKRDGYMRQTW